MKGKIIAIFVCMLVAIWSAFTVVASLSIENKKLVAQGNNIYQGGNTLISEYYYNNRVIEVDYGGSIVWLKGNLMDPSDAERLQNGNTLISELSGNRVIEVDIGGNIVWQYSQLNGPFDAERLMNGNTLIADSYNNRVIEVDSDGFIVWEKADLPIPTDAERLASGNTLISVLENDIVIEVDNSGNIVWQISARFPVDVERLSNGNTLITEYGYNNRVIEVDSSGTLVWEYNGSGLTFDAERLSNGNTLITEFAYTNYVIEVDSSGTIVWQYAANFPLDAERLTNPPSSPTISGPTSGKPGKKYNFKFNSVDPDGDDVKYFVDWGDNNSEWTGYNSSGTDVILKHSWSEKGNFTIKAKAIDENGAESDWGYFEIEIPRTRQSKYSHNFLSRLFVRFPNAFLLLRQILGLH